MGLPISATAQTFSEGVGVSLVGAGTGPSQGTSDPSKPNLGVAESYTYPAGDGTESASLSSSQIGIFQGSVFASASPPIVDTFETIAGSSSDMQLTVIALMISVTPPPPAKFQILQNLSGNVSSPSNVLETEAVVEGVIDVVPHSGQVYQSIKTVQSTDGVVSTSDQGPLNFTLSQGETLHLEYASDTEAIAFDGYNNTPSSASASFDAMVGYIAPPGWGLYVENADGTPGRELHEFPAAVPEASTTVLFGLLLVLGLGSLIIARKKSVRA